jgi:hypothetical protein
LVLSCGMKRAYLKGWRYWRSLIEMTISIFERDALVTAGIALRFCVTLIKVTCRVQPPRLSWRQLIR